MKTKPILASASALVAIGLWAASVAFAAEQPDTTTSFVIGVSPFLEREVKDTVYRKVISFVVEDMPLGGSLRIYDAYNLQTVAELQIPNTQPFRSAKTRANQLAPPIQKLKQFLAAEHPRPESAGENLTNAIRFPQFLDFVRTAAPSAPQPVSVLLLGSPLYIDPREPSFSMSDGYFPSDGHLRVGRDRSAYGVTDRINSLPNYSLHYCYFGEPFVTDMYREKVARFWQLFSQAEGATLATFTGDLTTAFKNARLPADQQRPFLASVEADPTQTKLEMLRVTRDVAANDWISREGVSTSRRAPSTTVGPMKIGIRWKGDWDLDLYASAKPGAETLFFHHTRCPEGYYYKDHRHSPDREYEFIEFTSPVNVLEVEAMVNFYQGNASEGASGEIRVEFDNKLYGSTFRINAIKGNRGQFDSTQEEYWTRINLSKLLHLDSPLSQLRRGDATRER